MNEEVETATGRTASVAHESALRFTIAVALALLLATSNFLLLNEHSILELDSAIAAAALCVTGAIFSALYLWKNRYWRAALQALFVFLAIDLVGNDLTVAAIVSSVVPAFVIIKDRSLLFPASVFLGAMLASSMAGIGTSVPFKSVRMNPERFANPSKPTIVHLVLDEHVGIDGIQDPDADVATTRSRLRQAYVGSGFRVYGRAFSEHFHTVNALPWVTNFGGPAKIRGGKGGVRIDENRYFGRLYDAGYRLDVIQTAFANFCAVPNVSACTTYSQQNLGALRRYRLSTIDRSKVIFFKVLDQSSTLLGVSGLIDHVIARANSARADIPQSTLKLKSRTNTFAGLTAFDELIAKLKGARPGEAYFAHILLPHTPYVVGSNCDPRRFENWEDRDAQSPLQLRQARYLDQVWCAERKLREAIEALNQSPAAQNYVVIVHGDHGSRLTKSDPDITHRGKYDADDMIAGFSTLFAIKAKGVPAGYDPRPASVASLLRQFAESDFKIPPSPSPSDFNAEVYLDDENWKPRDRDSLPAEWIRPHDISTSLN